MDQAERERLIVEHVSLVHHIVGRIGARLPENVERDDLVSAGLLGLIKAIDRYDPNRGAKLATYASSVIRGEIMETLRAKDWVPRSVRRTAREMARNNAQLEYELGRPPSDAEMAAAMDMDLDAYRKAVDDTSCATLLSLDEAYEGDDDRTDELPDSTPNESFGDPAESYEQQDLRRLVVEAIDRLPERERMVVALYYQDGLTLREIGEVLSVTESRVCQIHGQAIQRLRGIAARELTMPVAR